MKTIKKIKTKKTKNKKQKKRKKVKKEKKRKIACAVGVPTKPIFKYGMIARILNSHFNYKKTRGRQ